MMDEFRDSAARQSWKIRRGCIATLVFVASCIAYVVVGRLNDWIYEEQPFAGPLAILVSTSGHRVFKIGLGLLGLLTPGICLPAFRSNPTTITVCVLSSILWIGISYFTAMIAAV